MTEAEKIPSVLDASMAQVGEVYARALLNEAQRHGKLDLIVEQLTQFAEVLRQLPKLRATLESPKVPYDAKANVIDAALKGRAEPLLINGLKLLAKRGRFACFSAVERAARDIQDEVAGRVRGEVVSAVPLDGDAVRRLEEKLSQMVGRQVIVTVRVDPDILGGVVVRIGDTVYDTSVRNRLEKIKAKAVKGVADSIRRSIDQFVTDAV